MIAKASPKPVKPMRVGIANDMEASVRLLQYAVEREMGRYVVWQVRDGVEAVCLCARNRPDLVLMDMLVPVMDTESGARKHRALRQKDAHHGQADSIKLSTV